MPSRGTPNDRTGDVLERLRAERTPASPRRRGSAHVEGRAEGATLNRLRRRILELVVELEDHRAFVVIVAAVLAIALGLLVALTVIRLVGGRHDAVAVAATPATIPAVPMPSAEPSGPAVVVYATGAIRSPGVYRLAQGSRVVDLLERAGGPGDGLDLSRVNLAAALIDGSRVWFPIVGESSPSLEIDGGSSGVPTRVDLNHASATQLTELPGIGPAIAAAIVAYRTARGPFRSVEGLRGVKGMTTSKIDALRSLVVLG